MNKLQTMAVVRAMTMMMASRAASTSGSCQSIESFGTSVPVENKVTMEGQTLGLEKVENARQLGGYVTTSGMKIRMDKLLRTGKLDEATPEDLKKLADCGLRTVIDLRTTVEHTDLPDPELQGVEMIHVKIIDESGIKKAIRFPKDGIANHGQVVLDIYKKGFFCPEMYVNVADAPVSQTGFKEFLQTVAKKSAQDGAILYHCTSGKDRVGMATVLLLSILEVDRKTIEDDFALTNEYNEKAIAYIKAEVGKLTDDPKAIEGSAGLAGVIPAYMENFLNHLDERYGSPLKYITDVLGVTGAEIEAIRQNLLEPIS